MIIDYKQIINLKEESMFNLIKAKQNDTLNLIFNIFDGSSVADLTDWKITLRVNLNDTNYIIQSDHITILNNVVMINCSKDICSVVGKHRMELTFVKGENQKTSFDIPIEVKSSVLSDSQGNLKPVVFTSLQELDIKVNEANKNIKDIENVVIKLEEDNNTANVNITNLTTQNKKAIENINNLSGENSTANSNILDLVTANSTASENIANLNKENNAAAINLEALSKFDDADTLLADVNKLKTDFGDKTKLKTTDKSNLINAINENTTQLNEIAKNKIDKSKVINNTNATEEGFILDARQGKMLDDKMLCYRGDVISVDKNLKDYTQIGQWYFSNSSGFEDAPLKYFILTVTGDMRTTRNEKVIQEIRNVIAPYEKYFRTFNNGVWSNWINDCGGVILANGVFRQGDTITLSDNLNKYNKMIIISGDAGGTPNVLKNDVIYSFNYPSTFSTTFIGGLTDGNKITINNDLSITVTTFNNGSSYIRKIIGFNF